MTEIYGTIYHITCLQDFKPYIGQTIHSYHKRCVGHVRKLTDDLHHNPHLQYAFNKYGSDNFITGSLYHAYSREELDAAEDYFIWYYDSMNPDKGYNLKGGGHSGTYSEESKRKMSLIKQGSKRSPDTCAKISEALRRRSPESRASARDKMKTISASQEYRDKLSAAKKGKLKSPETRARMSEAQKKRFRLSRMEEFNGTS